MTTGSDTGSLSPAASGRPPRILQLTDCHLPPVPGQRVQGLDTEGSLRTVIDRALNIDQPYDLALLTGDLAEAPTPSAYAYLRDELARMPMPYVCLPGNHDDPEVMRRFLPGAGVVTAPSPHTLGTWQILCLDSTAQNESSGFLRNDQLALVESALGGDGALNLLIAVHHHPVPCGSPWMDTMMIRNADALIELLATRTAASCAVVFGHIHQAFDETIRGIRFLGSPATSCQVEPHSTAFRRAALPPGYRWLELGAAGELQSGVIYVDGGCAGATRAHRR